MRHVSRTHRVALGWLFDRINLEPKIQIKYADTKNQLVEKGDPVFALSERINSSLGTESELSLRSRSFLHKVTDQVRKRQKQSFIDATDDGEKHSVIWGMLSSSTLQASVILVKNHSDNWHSIKHTENLTVKQMFDISGKMITEQSNEIYGINTFDGKTLRGNIYLWLVMKKSSVFSAHSLRILCCVLVRYTRTPSQTLWRSGRRSRCPQSFLRRSSTGFPWRSGCRAQGTARCGGSRRRKTRRKSKGRKERSNLGECAMDMTVDDKVFVQDLSQWGVRWSSSVKQCALCASSAHDVHHASVCVNVVLVYLLCIVSCMLMCVFTSFHLLFVMML